MNAPKLIIATLIGTDLSSRASAVQARNEITRLISAGQHPVSLDFSNVRTVTHSFADELFAILVMDFGKAWFRQSLKIENMSSSIRETVLESISLRLNSQPHST